MVEHRLLSCGNAREFSQQVEQAVLRIAASLADPGIAVRLRENLGNLDQHNIALVTDAITAANG